MTPQEYADQYNVYVARDRDGQWHIFNAKPEVRSIYGDGRWINPYVGFKKHPLVEITCWPKLSWKDSLTTPYSKQDRQEELGFQEDPGPYRYGQLILCWNPHAHKKYAMVRHFVCYTHEGRHIRVEGVSNSSDNSVNFHHHRPFTQELAETPMNEWLKPEQERCPECGRGW